MLQLTTQPSGAVLYINPIADPDLMEDERRVKQPYRKDATACITLQAPADVQAKAVELATDYYCIDGGKHHVWTEYQPWHFLAFDRVSIGMEVVENGQMCPETGLHGLWLTTSNRTILVVDTGRIRFTDIRDAEACLPSSRTLGHVLLLDGDSPARKNAVQKLQALFPEASFESVHFQETLRARDRQRRVFHDDDLEIRTTV